MENKYDLTEFEQGLRELGITLEQTQMDAFLKYYELLVEWNSFMNLTAITEFKEVCIKHFLDSLSLIKVMNCHQNLTLIDIGTGAGFPGIPLKIAFPELKITLLDSLGKRVKFLNEVINQLGLKDIEAIHGRAEDYAMSKASPLSLRETFDVCVSRAVANLATLSELCIPFVKLSGSFVSYKAGDCGEEIKEAAKAVDKMGGKTEIIEEYMVPTSDIYRVLLKITKEKATPKAYPRKAGTPAKEPVK